MRSFIAVELAEEVRNRIAELLGGFNGIAQVKWVEKQNLHVTVKFLGDLSENQVLSVSRLLRQSVKDIRNFELAFSRLGAFPNSSSPRTVWIGVDDPQHQLEEIARRLEDSLESVGVPREKRAFRPHLTLGRVKGFKAPARLAESVARHKDFSAGRMLVKELVFMRSDLTPQGPVYSPIERVALAAQEETTERAPSAG